jgi:hypothetical protein
LKFVLQLHGNWQLCARSSFRCQLTKVDECKSMRVDTWMTDVSIEVCFATAWQLAAVCTFEFQMSAD